MLFSSLCGDLQRPETFITGIVPGTRPCFCSGNNFSSRQWMAEENSGQLLRRLLFKDIRSPSAVDQFSGQRSLTHSVERQCDIRNVSGTDIFPVLDEGDFTILHIHVLRDVVPDGILHLQPL